MFSSNLDTNFSITDEVLATCGSNYCPAQIVKLDSNLSQEDSLAKNVTNNFEKAKDLSSIYTIAGIFLVLSFLAAFIVTVFVDPLTRFVENEGEEVGKKSGGELLVATFRHMKKREQLLIIPITFWSGIEQGFFGADFTAVRAIYDSDLLMTPALIYHMLKASKAPLKNSFPYVGPYL